MCLNATKSNIIIIHNSKGKRFSNTSLVINGQVIPKTNIAKLLGVLINVKADCNDHITKVEMFHTISTHQYVCSRSAYVSVEKGAFAIITSTNVCKQVII